MNNPDDMPEDEVTRAYERASDAEAGRPAPQTRAAILAEARAATLRRTPVANESRYVWRAVAGVAVLGVAVLLWKQAERQVSPDLTVATEPAIEAERGDAARPAAPEAAAPETRAREAPPMPQVAADNSSATNSPVAKDERDVASTTSIAALERESKRGEETAGAGIASVAAPAANSMEKASADTAPAMAAGALRQQAVDYQAIVQREFPEVWRGDLTASIVWVLMDAAGRVTRKGELSETQPLASVAAPSDAWTMVQVKTASGRSLQLAVMKVD